MKLQEAIRNNLRFSTPALPELRYLSTAAHRVQERWPDVAAPRNEREREGLAQKLRAKVERDDWANTRLSFVIAAAAAVFDAERRDRPDLAETRAFLYAEIRASSSETFLSGLLRAHLEGYLPGAPHSRALSEALAGAVPRMGPAGRFLLEAVPELLDPNGGPDQLAVRMANMSDPFAELMRTGIRNPHGPGFMELAHLSLTERVRSGLARRDLIDWYVNWLRPPGREARTSGAERAIEALVHPWLTMSPDDNLRSHLVETLIEMYGDPRIKSGGVWAGVGASEMAVIHRWLTREDMRFFTGVVDAAQKDAMWPPRRDFWLKLYDEGLIDAAWVAFSAHATQYAREHLMRQEARNAGSRFGFQRARQNTSLLIMKIGDKIMVDGCHSYKTHVFNRDDPMAPQLFLAGYDCDEIMRRSPASKPHNSIPAWSRWVRDMINADVKRSHVTRPYTRVLRPRMDSAPHIPTPVRRNTIQAASPYAYRAQPWPSESPGQTSGVRGASAGAGRAGPGAAAHALRRQIGSRDELQTSDSRSDQQGERRSLRETRFSSLTDRLIAYGPAGADALSRFLERPDDRKPRPMVSPNAREGLEWLRTQKAPLPHRLRNSLEHLLTGLKSTGRDLDDLFRGRSQPASGVTMPRLAAAPRRGQAPQVGGTSGARDGQAGFPALTGTAVERLELLFEHVDAVEAFAQERYPFSPERSLYVAINKLRQRDSTLRPAEIDELQQIYGRMRTQASNRR